LPDYFPFYVSLHRQWRQRNSKVSYLGSAAISGTNLLAYFKEANAVKGIQSLPEMETRHWTLKVNGK
jgi:hypothetical protein